MPMLASLGGVDPILAIETGLTKGLSLEKNHKVNSGTAAGTAALVDKATKRKRLRLFATMRFVPSRDAKYDLPRTENTLPKLEEQAILTYLIVLRNLIIL